MARLLAAILLALLAVLGLSGPPAQARGEAAAGASDALPAVSLAQLPREARETLELIRKGGPFPHDRDGIVFGNFEKRLPLRERGYYREYTVRTPGVRHRGARRLVAGGCPAASGPRKGAEGAPVAPCPARELYYTDDHYRSFSRVTP